MVSSKFQSNNFFPINILTIHFVYLTIKIGLIKCHRFYRIDSKLFIIDSINVLNY